LRFAAPRPARDFQPGRVGAVEPGVSATDQELVARCRAGERDAFGELVERYQQRLVRYLRGLVGNEEDARDVAQEAFLRAYTHLARFDPSRSFSVWLYGIASHVAVDWLRRRARRAGLDQRAPEPPAPPPRRRKWCAASWRRACRRRSTSCRWITGKWSSCITERG